MSLLESIDSACLFLIKCTAVKRTRSFTSAEARSAAAVYRVCVCVCERAPGKRSDN